MKKNLVILLVVALSTFGFMACGDSGSSDSDCVKVCAKIMECSSELSGYSELSGLGDDTGCEYLCEYTPETYADALCCIDLNDCTDFINCTSSDGASCNGNDAADGDEAVDGDSDSEPSSELD